MGVNNQRMAMIVFSRTLAPCDARPLENARNV